MIDIRKIIKDIIERLKPLNPNKIILFGSYANGKPRKDSDIDLYVVTNDDFMPSSWKEKNDIHLKYAEKLYDIQNIIPIDLIIHTKQMNKKFIEMDGMFCRKILKEGMKLYETVN